MCFPNARITADAGGQRQGMSQDGPSEEELADPDRYTSRGTTSVSQTLPQSSMTLQTTSRTAQRDEWFKPFEA